MFFPHLQAVGFVLAPGAGVSLGLCRCEQRVEVGVIRVGMHVGRPLLFAPGGLLESCLLPLGLLELHQVVGRAKAKLR